jgi:hypothetical protein
MRKMARCWTATALAAFAVLLFAGSLPAGVVTQHYDFAEPVIKEAGEYDRVTMDGAWHYGDPGDPILPMVGARLLLPPGEDVAEVNVIPGEKVVLGDGLLLEPGQRQYPLSYDGPIERIEADYAGRGSFPGRIYDAPTVGTFRGYAIANLALHPVEYDPATGTVSYYRSMDVEIRTAPSAQLRDVAERMIRHDSGTQEQLGRYVDNELVSLEYAAIERVKHGLQAPLTLDPSLGYDYLIVTTDTWDDYLGDIVTLETNRGHKAGIFLKSWITANYGGIDEADQIRNFLIDAYSTWDSDYVLLVGDARTANGIPHRGMWNDAYGESEYDIPCDLYYVALDGNWNTDGDTRWGEYSPEEADLYPEMAVGRFCVDDVSEIQNSVTKTLRYTDPPAAVRPELDTALMVGELLWSSPLTYGGTYKDQILYGGSYDGYTTVGFFPSMPGTGTLYDRNGTWSKTTLINMMESGLNIVNHLGHCNTQYSMKMDNSDIPSFDNDGTNHTLNFAYSQGCYNGAFDDRDPYGYVGDCFAEEFATDDDGAVALVMNSRYGWGDPGGTNGSSQYFDREFFDAIFGEHIYPIGDVNNDSKVDVIWALSYGANRWCFYELNVFGDPALRLWTREPANLVVNHAGSIMVGQPDLDVTVYDGSRGPVQGAVVTIYTDDYAVYDTGVTDASGLVTVHPNAGDVGVLNVKVHANNFLTHDSTAEIAPAEGPYLAFDHYAVDDDQSGGSNGNGNATVNAGETIELVVTLKNVGVDPAYGVTATLTSTSGRIELIDDTETYGDIGAGGTATCADDYDFFVESDTPDGELIPFTLTIADAARTLWQSSFGIVVAAPVVVYSDHVVDDPLYGGNGSGCIEAGETVTVTVDLSNTGSAGAWNVSGVLTCADPHVVIASGTAGIPVIGAGGTQTLTPDYRVTILPDCPEFHEIDLDLAITADWGYATSAQFSILTAGGSTFADNIESGQGEWTHGVVTPGFTDQWHIETYRSSSPTHSWKFGGAGSSDYTDSCDGALYMRPMCIGADGELTFWDWLYAEEESATSAWDCGLLEISTDGGVTWLNLPPVGGYSHLKNSNAANPLPEGTPCWSGYHDWRLETFDLSAYHGETIQIRFRFASDGYVTEEGWYVDDINLTFTGGSSDVGDELVGPRTFALRQNVPNPFNPITVIRYQLPQTADVRIDVFNIAGRLVKTIVDERQEAGYKEVAWDGRNEAGEKVASGVYMYRMEAGDYTSKRTMVLLK